LKLQGHALLARPRLNQQLHLLDTWQLNGPLQIRHTRKRFAEQEGETSAADSHLHPNFTGLKTHVSGPIPLELGVAQLHIPITAEVNTIGRLAKLTCTNPCAFFPGRFFGGRTNFKVGLVFH
jgi:hypothetical protein